MATNASTWFYAEPEHKPYLIEERVNHTFWNNRISALYLDCTQAEPPFRMAGEWHGIPVNIEWVPNDYFTLETQPGDQTDLLIIGIKEMLGFPPAISYVDAEGWLIAEWYTQPAETRIQEIQSNTAYQNIKRYQK